MDFSLSAEQEQIRASMSSSSALVSTTPTGSSATARAASRKISMRAMAKDRWLGIAMPEEFGGAGLGIAEAAIMMQAVAELGAAMSGASAIHMNIFGLQPGRGLR